MKYVLGWIALSALVGALYVAGLALLRAPDPLADWLLLAVIAVTVWYIVTLERRARH